MPENGSARACSRLGPARPSPRRTDKDCHAGQRLATHVLAIGARSVGDLRRCTACLPPNRCAAHREPLSSVDVDLRRRGYGVDVYIQGRETALLSAYGGAWRSAMRGFGGVASDNRQDSNHRRLGASAEGRLAWPPAVSAANGQGLPCRRTSRHGRARDWVPLGRLRGERTRTAMPDNGSRRTCSVMDARQHGGGQGLQCRTTARDARARDRGPLGWRLTSMYGLPPAQSLCSASRAVLLRRTLPTAPWGRSCCLYTGSRHTLGCLRVEGRGGARCGDPAA
jgi:hypothetical protein